MIARYLAAPALLLVLVAGCDTGTPPPTSGTTPPVNANAGDATKKLETAPLTKASGIKPIN
jgi:hypothetical protein